MADDTLKDLANKINDIGSYLGIGGAKKPTTEAAPIEQPATGTASNPINLPVQSAPVQQSNSMEQPVVAPAMNNLVPMQKTESTTRPVANAEDQVSLDKTQGKIDQAYGDLSQSIKNQSKATNSANLEADKTFGSTQDKAKEYADQIAQGRKNIQSDLAEMDSQIEKVKATQYKDFWADKSTAGKIGMALAVGLGQYAGTMTGTQNMAWNILQKAMDDDFRLQQANHDRQIKNIELLKLGVDQKQKLMDVSTREFETYKVARADYVTDAVNKEMAKSGKGLTLAMQELLSKTEAAAGAAKQSYLMNTIDKEQSQITSAIQQRPIDHKQAISDISNDKSPIGAYKKALTDYKEIESFKNSKNYNASVIKLVADGLKQGSYDPSKFDPTTRSVFEKLKDAGSKALSSGEEQQIVKSAEKYFEENLKSQFNSVKDSLPSYLQAGMMTSAQQTGKPVGDFYGLMPPQSFLNKTKDLGANGMTRVPENKK